MSAITAATASIILSEDFFGQAYFQLISKLTCGDKPSRKDAFNAIKTMAKGAGLLSSKEKILGISLGANVSGTKVVVITIEVLPKLALSVGPGSSITRNTPSLFRESVAPPEVDG